MKKPNILFLGDPRSIHDLKWISFFSSQNLINAFLISRKAHVSQMAPEYLEELKLKYDITYLGDIEDYSVVRLWKNKKNLEKLKKSIEVHNIDIFHIFYAEPNALWGKSAKTLGLPIFLTTRGSDVLVGIPHFQKKGTILSRWIFMIYQKSFKKIDEIISTSSKQVDQLQALFPILKTPHVIRTGIDIAKMRKEEFLPPSPTPEKDFILFPRNMAPIYQHEFALEAIERLPPKIKGKYDFVFVQKDSPNTKYVQEIKDKMDSIQGVRFIFYPSLAQNQLFALYKNTSLVVMTPHSDGSPVSAMEAMFFCAPLILPPLAYDKDLFGGVPQFSSWNTLDLTNKIIEVLGSPNPDQLRENFEKVSKQADRKVEMNRLYEIYTKYVH